MKNNLHLVLVLLFPLFLNAQDYYFPPSGNDEWETISPEDAGFCSENLAELNTFLDEKNTKAFIVLKDGKIVIEEYFNDFTQDSVWYWASAAKTITGFLIGIAQEDGLLDIDDKTSQYLGTGWTSAPAAKEDMITIKHQLSMTTGLDDGVPDPDCLEPSCLQYLSDADERWSYHNAPYRLLQDVIENASGQDLNIYTYQKLLNKIGMTGAWFNRIFFSKPRSMARYGSLILNQGNWDGTQVLGDMNYLNEMVNSSNDLNPSYGYLWWLNGKGSYMLPSTQITFNTDLIPNAPAEVYSALGKNDQKIYIYPSEKIVVIRMGESSETSLFALSTFDNELWGKLSTIFCDESTSLTESSKDKIKLFPNPVNDLLFFEKNQTTERLQVKIYNNFGQEVRNEILIDNNMNVAELPVGIYFVQVVDRQREILVTQKFLKK